MLLLPLTLLACAPGDGLAEGDLLPAFALEDVNSTSESFEDVVSTDTQAARTAWYFGHSTWSYCSSQFGYLDVLQKDLLADDSDVSIFGINDVGYESGNPDITEGRDLPWLQNTDEVDAWNSWGVEYRDVVVIEPDGTVVGVYNLSENDLADPSSVDELLDLLGE